MNTAIFYDGSHANIAFDKIKKGHKGYVDFKALNKIILNHLSEKLDGVELNSIFNGWYQGITGHIYLKNNRPSDENYRKLNDLGEKRLLTLVQLYINQRNLWAQLFRAGMETIFLENNEIDKKEKGIDVGLTIGAVNLAHEGKMDIAIIVSNDGDFGPLLHNLRRKGIKTYVFTFQQKDSNDKKHYSHRLRNNANDVFLITPDMVKEIFNVNKKN